MPDKLTVGSLFSGIQTGGFDLGLERAGMEVVWQCEIDKAAQSVLRRRFPDATIYDDVTTLGRDVESVDLICGGFPCQDLSVAGRRAGLAGERSGLWYQFHRILGELAPRWVLVENVPGLLSSNGGADFAVVLRGLVELGYGVAWRILDAQYFGVAQRRRRVFIVGCLGDRRGAAEVLFEPESLPGNPAPSREAGTRLATDTAACIRSGGKGKRGWIGDAEHGLVAATLNSGGNNGGFRTEPGEHPQLTCGGGKPGDGYPCVAFTERTRAEGRTFEAQEELAYALCNPGSGGRTHSRQIAQGMSVRRLTPTECERLQGFPDGWTDGQSDSARYRQLGNAVCVNVAEWIGRRIMAVAS